jgi:hypothetical protein
LLHLVGDLFELYDDARTYKPKITSTVYAADRYVHYLDDIFLDNLTVNFRLYRLYIVEGNVKIIINGD